MFRVAFAAGVFHWLNLFGMYCPDMLLEASSIRELLGAKVALSRHVDESDTKFYSKRSN